MVALCHRRRALGTAAVPEQTRTHPLLSSRHHTHASSSASVSRHFTQRQSERSCSCESSVEKCRSLAEERRSRQHSAAWVFRRRQRRPPPAATGLRPPPTDALFSSLSTGLVRDTYRDVSLFLSETRWFQGAPHKHEKAAEQGKVLLLANKSSSSHHHPTCQRTYLPKNRTSTDASKTYKATQAKLFPKKTQHVSLERRTRFLLSACLSACWCLRGQRSDSPTFGLPLSLRYIVT